MAKGGLTVLKVSLVALFLILSVSSYAQPVVAHASVAPQPGLLAMLGGGLVGLAALVRRHLSD